MFLPSKILASDEQLGKRERGKIYKAMGGRGRGTENKKKQINLYSRNTRINQTYVDNENDGEMGREE